MQRVWVSVRRITGLRRTKVVITTLLQDLRNRESAARSSVSTIQVNVATLSIIGDRVVPLINRVDNGARTIWKKYARGFASLQ
jgi:hypothetical protein